MKSLISYFFTITFIVLPFGCTNTEEVKKLKSLENCRSDVGKLFYIDNNAKNCECLFTELVKSGFSEEEIQWYTSLNTLGYSKLEKANSAQKKIVKYLEQTSILSACGIK